MIVKKATSSEIQFKVTLWSQRKKGEILGPQGLDFGLFMSDQCRKGIF